MYYLCDRVTQIEALFDNEWRLVEKRHAPGLHGTLLNEYGRYLNGAVYGVPSHIEQLYEVPLASGTELIK